MALDVTSGVCDVESDNDASDYAQLLDDKQCTSDLRWSDFRDVHGSKTGTHANTKATDEASDNEHLKVDGGCLEDGSDDEDDTGNEKRPLSGELVRDPAAVHGSEEGAELDHRGHQSFVEAGADSGTGDLGELSEELVHGKRDCHDTLTEACVSDNLPNRHIQ